MRWQGRRGSENVVDRRSMRGPVIAGAGVGGLLLLLLLLVLCVLCLGGDPRTILTLISEQGQQQQGPARVNPAEDELKEFVSVVLADTEDVWTELFREDGRVYVKPKLVLFSGSVRSACGFQNAVTGPFYCPLDQQVYIDLSFYQEMKTKLGAPGDFAQAYVIAHEVGHHVQKLLGISDEVHRAQEAAGEVEANELSVRLELQADFLAGVWAHHAQQNWRILEPGDVEEALNAAEAIGDDRLQMKARGYAVPETFSHGTSEQRARWFFHGLKTGDMNQGDTFGIPYDEL